MTPDKPDDLRAAVLRDFSVAGQLPELQRVVQHGEDPATVRYTFHFITDDGQAREVRVPNAATLLSRARFDELLLVVLRRATLPCKPAEWRDRIAVLIEHATDVEERPGERFCDTVAEWIGSYADRASTDRDGAAALRAPFREGEMIYLVAAELTKYVRREYSEQVKRPEILEALADLGFERLAVNVKKGSGHRTTVSYYRGALDRIQAAA